VLYVSVLEGDTPENTRSIFTSRDPDVLRAVADAVSRKIAEGVPCEGSALRILGLVGDDEDHR
jgi:NaMN:DMB phosphoribosyltransferase